MSEPETNTWYPVTNALLDDGTPLPVVVAAHEVIANNLVAVLDILDLAFAPEVWDLDPDMMTEIGNRYTKYVDSPDEIAELVRARASGS